MRSSPTGSRFQQRQRAGESLRSPAACSTPPTPRRGSSTTAPYAEREARRPEKSRRSAVPRRAASRRRPSRADARHATASITWTTTVGRQPATPDSPAPYAATVYVGRDDGYGFRDVPWISEYKVWSATRKTRISFQDSRRSFCREETFRLNNSEWLQESVSSLYLQGLPRSLRRHQTSAAWRYTCMQSSLKESTHMSLKKPALDPHVAPSRAPVRISRALSFAGSAAREARARRSTGT